MGALSEIEGDEDAAVSVLVYMYPVSQKLEEDKSQLRWHPPAISKSSPQKQLHSDWGHPSWEIL